MIRHRPAGRGHPYLVEPDQRVPLRPLAGERFELRATTKADEASVRVELELDGALAELEALQRGPALPDAVSDYGRVAPRPEDEVLKQAQFVAEAVRRTAA